MRKRTAHGDANFHAYGDCYADATPDGDSNSLFCAGTQEIVCAHPAPYGDASARADSDSQAHADPDTFSDAHGAGVSHRGCVMGGPVGR